MNKSPAFQWYPKDILASARVQELSLAEEGAYRRLIDFCWINGSIPADPERCARLIGKGATTSIASAVQKLFIQHPTDPERLIHDRLELEREKQLEHSEKRKAAAEARWSKQGTPAEARGTRAKSRSAANALQGDSKCNANAFQVQCSASASSSASSSSIASSAAGEVEANQSDAKTAAAQQAVEIDRIADVLFALYGIARSGGWRLEGKFRSTAIELHGQSATESQIQGFWNYRTTKPRIEYFAGDFIAWRANGSVNGLGKQDGNGSAGLYVGGHPPDVNPKKQSKPVVFDSSPLPAQPDWFVSFKREVEARVNPEAFATWFAPLHFVATEGAEITVRVPDRVFEHWLLNNYRDVIEEALDAVGVGACSFVFQVAGELNAEEEVEVAGVARA